MISYEKNRQKFWKNSFVYLIIIAFFLIFSTSLIHSKKKVINQKNNVNKIIYDIPKLFGKNIDEIKGILGVPSGYDDEPTKLQMQKGLVEWEKAFSKNGYELLITYNAKTRKVIDFFIGTNDPNGVTSNYLDLIKICNLDTKNNKCKIQPVSSLKDIKKYTGVKIIPKKRL